MAETSKNLATKNPVETAIDIRDEKREKITKLKTFDLSYFIGKSYFDDDGSQNYLTSQPVFQYFQIFSNIIDKTLGLKSKGLPEETMATCAI